ncbi:MAG TPA: hypothetical protein V6D10_05815 [Trichocoleus sp.]|jgi:hypothetical protein
MPVSLTEVTLNPPFTVASLGDALKTACAAAGLGNPIADFSQFGYDRTLVYAVVTDASKAYGTQYLRLMISPNGTRFDVAQTLHSEFDLEDTTFPGYGGGESSWLLRPETLQIKSFASAEFKLIGLYQARLGNFTLLGTLRPTIQPAYWDENISQFLLININESGNIPASAWSLSDISPYAYTGIRFGFESFPSKKNPFTNQADLLAGVALYPIDPSGIFGICSPDLVLASDGNLNLGDVITLPDNKRYYCFVKPTSANYAIPLLRISDAT